MHKSDHRDHDSWSHVGPSGTHVALVIEYPESGLVQGAEEYLRHVAQRGGVDGEVAQRLRAVLEEWDARSVTPPGTAREASGTGRSR